MKALFLASSDHGKPGVVLPRMGSFSRVAVAKVANGTELLAVAAATGDLPCPKRVPAGLVLASAIAAAPVYGLASFISPGQLQNQEPAELASFQFDSIAHRSESTTGRNRQSSSGQLGRLSRSFSSAEASAEPNSAARAEMISRSAWSKTWTIHRHSAGRNGHASMDRFRLELRASRDRLLRRWKLAASSGSDTGPLKRSSPPPE